MKTKEVSKILKSKLPVEAKKEIFEKEIKKQDKVKKAVGIAAIAVIATGVTKIVADKMKERKMLKEIEAQEEAEFWEDYYEDFENVPVDHEEEIEDEVQIEEPIDEDVIHEIKEETTEEK